MSAARFPGLRLLTFADLQATGRASGAPSSLAPKVRPMTEPVARSLEYWADRRGGEAALFEGDQSLTYAAWNDYANLLAAAFVDCGLGVDDVIALRARPRMEGAIVSRAIGKIDARLLVIDRRLPVADVRHVLADSGAKALICDDEDPGRLYRALGGLALLLRASIDGGARGFASLFDLFPARAPRRFTRAHTPLIHYVRRPAGLRAITTPRRIIAPASRSRTPTPEQGASLITMPPSDAAVAMQVGQALGAGRSIVFPGCFDPDDVLRTIERRRITHWTATPAAFRRLMALPPETLARFDLSSLRDLRLDGAPAPPAMKTWIIETFGPVLSETYGCAETGPIARMTASQMARRPGSCGTPAPTVDIQVRDSSGGRLTPNETGEIWARSPHMIERYSGAGARDGDLRCADGYFRVGDIGRIDRDGFLFITGRTAEMTVPSSLLLERTEIESRLLAHAAVQDVAVIEPFPDDTTAPLRVFCELRPGDTIAAPELLRYLETQAASRQRRGNLTIVS